MMFCSYPFVLSYGIGFWLGLFPGVFFKRFAVGGEDLEMMEAGFLAIVTPHHFLVARDFKKFHRVTLGVVAGDDRVAVG